MSAAAARPVWGLAWPWGRSAGQQADLDQVVGDTPCPHQSGQPADLVLAGRAVYHLDLARSPGIDEAAAPTVARSTVPRPAMLTPVSLAGRYADWPRDNSSEHPESSRSCAAPAMHSRICGPPPGRPIGWSLRLRRFSRKSSTGVGYAAPGSSPPGPHPTTLLAMGHSTAGSAGRKSSTRSSSGTLIRLLVRPARSTLSEEAISSAPNPRR